jgi:hypothetical protein
LPQKEYRLRQIVSERFITHEAQGIMPHSHTCLIPPDQPQCKAHEADCPIKLDRVNDASAGPLLLAAQQEKPHIRLLYYSSISTIASHYNASLIYKPNGTTDLPQLCRQSAKSDYNCMDGKLAWKTGTNRSFYYINHGGNGSNRTLYEASTGLTFKHGLEPVNGLGTMLSNKCKGLADYSTPPQVLFKTHWNLLICVNFMWAANTLSQLDSG